MAALRSRSFSKERWAHEDPRRSLIAAQSTRVPFRIIKNVRVPRVLTRTHSPAHSTPQRLSQARRIPGSRPRSDLGGGHRAPQGCVGPRPRSSLGPSLLGAHGPLDAESRAAPPPGPGAGGGGRRINEDRLFPSQHPPARRAASFQFAPGLGRLTPPPSAAEGSPRPSSAGSLPLPSPRALASTPRPPSRSSPISFSLTLGGKLAIYGAPSDSGGARRAQRPRRERRALRGVTRDGSLPVPGTEGGAGAVAAASADCPGEAPEGLGPNYGVKLRQ